MFQRLQFLAVPTLRRLGEVTQVCFPKMTQEVCS
jgi:hypothetical protein